jgi:hypothetical protein
MFWSAILFKELFMVFDPDKKLKQVREASLNTFYTLPCG